ncbi:hypothetical protein [Actomonas aquatica]|uniref:Benzylsuccinate synthase n=1 Tax=Actomonas aquatica TaxID=2866162 RepID=A0ABZ1C586_9BACT|nr:hypothetical protein [Opitutus sp. WL0086]WRQ86893.1 hypothetical protein K1X11_018935 [Opitutus sp. WL0086]
METTTATTTKACATCSHFKTTDATEGECRRRAPQTIAFNVDDDVKFESRFPTTKASDWCGEYEQA